MILDDFRKLYGDEWAREALPAYVAMLTDNGIHPEIAEEVAPLIVRLTQEMAPGLAEEGYRIGVAESAKCVELAKPHFADLNDRRRLELIAETVRELPEMKR